MPNGRLATTFLHRPDQQLTVLQIGRRLNDARFGFAYSKASAGLAIGIAVFADRATPPRSTVRLEHDATTQKNRYVVFGARPPGRLVSEVDKLYPWSSGNNPVWVARATISALPVGSGSAALGTRQE